jgi:hypothetical protein
MDDRNGDLYASREAALAAGVPPRHIVEMIGEKRAIEKVAGRVRFAARHEAQRRLARRKAQKKSRARNR